MTVLLDTVLPRTLDEWVAELRARPADAGLVEGWLFEGREARLAAGRTLADAGVRAVFHSAYKPLVHHFLERVDLPGLRRVTVHYPLHRQAPERRFALEAYPLADMLAGIDCELLPQPGFTDSPGDLHYRVSLEWQDGRRRTDTVFAPNRLHQDPLGRTLLSPTAWLGGVARGCDHARAFELAIDCVRRHPWPAGEPYFERLDLRIDLPGIAHAPASETGWMNSHEALHEDLYFSLLEIFQQRSGRPAGDRRLQPGQIVPDVRPGADGSVRLRVAAVAYPVPLADEGEDEDPGEALAPLSRAMAPLSPARIRRELADLGGRAFRATSRQGRGVAGIYHPGSGPAVLISGGQHANETSGVVGVLRAGQALLSSGTTGAADAGPHVALIPLENPDGYALHRELCAVAPRHMHHAARYTALGDDLEYRETAPFYEREARDRALAMSGARLHVNLHGYPAHEWTRPMSGYIPRGFDLWTVPKGFFLIVRHHAGWGGPARRLAEAVCLALSRSAGLMAFNARQRAGYEAHAGAMPFEVIHGTACTVAEVDRPGSAEVTLITEYPDETVHGEAFVMAHEAQMAVVLAAVAAWPGCGWGELCGRGVHPSC